MYQITYSSEQAFYDGCYKMMKLGACYVANHHSLTITLTGGYCVLSYRSFYMVA